MGDLQAASISTNNRQALCSKNAIPKPSAWSPVMPERWAKPENEKLMSVGVAQFMPSNSHML